MRLTTGNIYLADGNILKNNGIHPDIIIKKEDENTDFDDQLDLAQRLIKHVKELKSHLAISAMLDYYKSDIAGNENRM